MGILDLFVKPPDEETAEQLLREGQEKLWRRQMGEAGTQTSPPRNSLSWLFRLH
jgi:hypothetical protein